MNTNINTKYKQAGRVCKYKEKEIRQIPEFLGQQAQQVVEVNGVVLVVVGLTGTLVQVPPHLAIHWHPPQSRRSQPGIRTSVNFGSNPKKLIPDSALTL